MRINRLIIIFAALATLAGLLSGCFSPTMGEKPVSAVLTEEAKGGNFELSLIVPNYRSWDFSQAPGARVIDPQTATVVVTALGGLLVESFAYPGDGILTDIGNNSYSWELNITLPIWNYGPGNLEVTLKDSGGTTLTRGINQESFNLGTSSTVSLTIGCIPELHTGVAVTDPATPVSGGAITSGHNKYFSFNVAHGKQYTVSVTNGIGGEPDLYLFDQSGIPEGYCAASGGSASLPAYQATYGGKLYVGVNAVGADVTAFELSVSSNSAAVGSSTVPLINELYFYPPEEWEAGSAVEFFNPTASDIDMSGYKLDIGEPGPITTTITLPAGSVVPANGFLVLINDTENWALWRMCYAESTEFFPSGWWYGGNLEVILKDATLTELDMLRLNSAPPETGTDWTGGGFAAESSTVARDIADVYADSDNSSDWINTYGTLGLPNDYTEDVDIIIELE